MLRHQMPLNSYKFIVCWFIIHIFFPAPALNSQNISVSFYYQLFQVPFQVPLPDQLQYPVQLRLCQF